jgi:hypothetical protein
MTTTEHLQLIKAECERLLAIAEKRTQGEWYARPRSGPGAITAEVCYGSIDECITDGTYEIDDSAYIAACAGRAEAGWRATIAAIDGLDDIDHSRPYQLISRSILAAWPIGLLTKNQQ